MDKINRARYTKPILAAYGSVDVITKANETPGANDLGYANGSDGSLP